MSNHIYVADKIIRLAASQWKATGYKPGGVSPLFERVAYHIFSPSNVTLWKVGGPSLNQNEMRISMTSLPCGNAFTWGFFFKKKKLKSDRLFCFSFSFLRRLQRSGGVFSSGQLNTLNLIRHSQRGASSNRSRENGLTGLVRRHIETCVAVCRCELLPVEISASNPAMPFMVKQEMFSIYQ